MRARPKTHPFHFARLSKVDFTGRTSGMIGMAFSINTLLTNSVSIMPWTNTNYPDSLKNFMAPVRKKAIEIANALLADGRSEDSAIAIATAKAKEWAEKRGMKVRKSRLT
ncbi:MAG: hypothetical protein QM669_02665 [Siphonobacter sp.]